MTKQEKISERRKKIANLTDMEKENLTSRALITTVEGHILSSHNTIWVYIQSWGRGITPTVVGGYKQWKKANRQVKKGEHGSIIFFPVGGKDKEGNTEDENLKFYTATIFDISQTEETQKITEIDKSFPKHELNVAIAYAE